VAWKATLSLRVEIRQLTKFAKSGRIVFILQNSVKFVLKWTNEKKVTSKGLNLRKLLAGRCKKKGGTFELQKHQSIVGREKISRGWQKN